MANDRERQEFLRRLMGTIGAVALSMVLVLLSFVIGWLQPVMAFFAGVGMFICFSWLWKHWPVLREALEKKKGGADKE